ncbi:putative acylaminoacyl-peptidase [Besnoitia besnoiti]|uniref:acylaminoacyl-peptidase n=1 Tax=Besnoitia besnoiti TaxID=94643 RepID=A0A2A9MJX6_BESBE|nr:putative acylaminoacyl-peptidase [Besnoitia besnoiti]PFH38275.1 putative acylaminoacyl-peptidase [Besnoitia besnoiti]
MASESCPRKAACLTGATTKQLRSAFALCSETVVTCLEARISAKKASARAQESVVALGQQKILNEKRFVGLTAGAPDCSSLSTWPLGALPSLAVLSPSGDFFACVVETSSRSNGEHQPSVTASSQPEYRVELFGRGAAHVGPVTAMRAPAGTKPWQGSVGGGAFCPTKEELFIYTAEAPKSDRRGGCPEAGSEARCKDATCPGSGEGTLDAYEYKADWGEQLVGKRKGRLFLADFKRRSVKMLKPPTEATACGQPRWLSDGSGVICTNWDLEPYCLGLIYCMNRPSKLYLAQLSPTTAGSRGPEAGETADDGSAESQAECKWVQISGEEDFAAWSPSVLRDATKDDSNTQRVAYLSLEKGRPETLPHMCAPRIKALTLRRDDASSAWKVVARETLAEPLAIEPSVEPLWSCSQTAYSGTYTDRLGPWVHEKFLFVNTFIGARQAVVVVDTHGEGCLGEVHFDSTSLQLRALSKLADVGQTCSSFSLRLHDITPDWLLLEASSLAETPRLLLAKLSLSSSGLGVDASLAGSICLGGSSDQARLPWSPQSLLRNHLKRLECRYLSGGRHTLLRWKESPRKDGKRALGVVLHGGPHSVAANIFSAEATFLTLIGFDVFAVNYRGSLGFGQKELLSLLGNVGTQDVNDVKQAVDELLDSDRHAYSASRTVVVGGSHGGFLTCHLIGQFPDLFAAASTRNPVTDLSSMARASDIPDWCVAEGWGEQFHPGSNLSESQLAALFKSSPIAHAQHVRTPLLLGIGGSDKRVPPFQGVVFHKLLLGQGKVSRLLFYPEADHRIEQPQYAEDYWVNSAIWFIERTGGPDALKEDVLQAATC